MSDPPLEFELVHEQFRPRVLRYLARLVGEADAEDLTQSVMLKVSDSLAGFRRDSTVSTWIYRIATNVALDRLRQRRARPVAVAEDEFDEDQLPEGAQSESAETAAIRNEMAACIDEFVARLPAHYKTVMILSDIEGFSNDEIARMLGLTLDTVKIRLHRGREKLRKELQAGCTFHSNASNELGCDRKPSGPITFSPRR